MISENIAILIPILKQNHKLVELSIKLNQIDLAPIVVVDDGSENSTQAVFEEVQMYHSKVYHHKYNRGKDAALTTGIEHIKKNQPQIISVILPEADGHYGPNDILKVAKALATANTFVLGTKELSHPNAQLTSKIGKLFWAIYYKLRTGKFSKETETRLVGIPAKHFDFVPNVAGDRNDNEIRLFEQMNERNITYRSVDIDYIYEKERGTHFSAIRDSYEIFKMLIKNIASSLLSAVVDITSFMFFVYLGNSVFLATAIGRVISGIFNFSLNKVWVFEKKDSHKSRNESLKYLALFIAQMFFSGLLTDAINNSLRSDNSLLISKMLADCFLFITNFIVQRFWIFSTN